MIDRAGFWLEFRGLLVAIAARNRNVPACQKEVGLLVASQRKRRWFISFKIVAAVASIEIGRSCELTAVLVAVAVSAALEIDFEQSVFAPGDVALRAL